MASFDLHIHSAASDGEFDATSIERIARDRSLDLVCITDHDEGRESIRLATMAPDIAVAGIEITCRGFGGYADLLGIGLERPDLLRESWVFERVNRHRVRLWTERLTELGWQMADVDVGEEHRASWIVSRRVFAARGNRSRLRTDGFTTEAIFRSEMLTKGKPAHIEGEILTGAMPVEAGVAAILRAGGIPVMAHPGLGPMRDAGFDAGVQRLIEQGLGGLEAIHPAHSAETERRVADIAEGAGILIGAGSDAHDGDEQIGRVMSRSGLDLQAILTSWLDRLGRTVRPA